MKVSAQHVRGLELMEEDSEAWQCHVLFDFLLPFPRLISPGMREITNAMWTVLSVWVIVFSRSCTFFDHSSMAVDKGAFGGAEAPPNISVT